MPYPPEEERIALHKQNQLNMSRVRNLIGQAYVNPRAALDKMNTWLKTERGLRKVGDNLQWDPEAFGALSTNPRARHLTSVAGELAQKIEKNQSRMRELQGVPRQNDRRRMRGRGRSR